MNTQVDEKTKAPETEVKERQAVVPIAPPRLPYHAGLKGRFDIDIGGWGVIIDTIFPGARTIEAVLMALNYCEKRKLDVFKRPVHIVPMWSKAKGGYIETIWPGIAELRTTASRTKSYAGIDDAAWGQDVIETFNGSVKKGQNAWEDRTIDLTFPEFCQITVYRMVEGGRCKFVGPKVYWKEAYGSIGASVLPNDMWEGRARGQLEKCAEAAALRRAFPEEIGNELTAEEMAGQTFDDVPEMKDITPTEPAPPRPTREEPKQPEEPAAPTEAETAQTEANARELDKQYAGTVGPPVEEEGDPRPFEITPGAPESEPESVKRVILYVPGKDPEFYTDTMAFFAGMASAVALDPNVWFDTRNQQTVSAFVDLDPDKYGPHREAIEAILNRPGPETRGLNKPGPEAQ